MLVEIDTYVSPIEAFDVKLPSGTIYTQYVYFENLPKFCSNYFMFGHLREKCKYLHSQNVETHVPVDGKNLGNPPAEENPDCSMEKMKSLDAENQGSKPHLDVRTSIPQSVNRVYSGSNLDIINPIEPIFDSSPKNPNSIPNPSSSPSIT